MWDVLLPSSISRIGATLSQSLFSMKPAIIVPAANFSKRSARNLLVATMFLATGPDAMAGSIMVQNSIFASGTNLQERVDNSEDLDVAKVASDLAYAGRGITGADKATAELGILKIETAASSTALNIHTVTIAAWSDTFLFSSPTFNGRAGQATVSVVFEYDLNSLASTGKMVDAVFNNNLFAGNNSSLFSAQHINNSGAVYESARFDVNDVNGSSSEGVVGRHDLTIDFVWGTGFTVTNLMGGTCTVAPSNSGGTASCAVDAFHSSYWAGFTNVMSEGSLVSNFNFSSGSGTDYSRSFVPTDVNGVPEPGSMLLLLFGLGGIFLHRRAVEQLCQSFN
jgi:hypothetical protein